MKRREMDGRVVTDSRGTNGSWRHPAGSDHSRLPGVFDCLNPLGRDVRHGLLCTQHAIGGQNGRVRMSQVTAARCELGRIRRYLQAFADFPRRSGMYF